MATLLMLKGLPASGKSTYAKELVSKGWKRVNKDDLRAMLDNSKWSRNNEEGVMDIRNQIIHTFLQAKQNVVVDDTNFAPIHEKTFRQLAEMYNATFEVKVFDTDPRTCIERDLARPNSVGAKVIMQMYFQYAKPAAPEIGLYPDCYVFDIDGTLAIMNNRGPFDWKKVGNDFPNEDIINIAKVLQTQSPIIVVSGRDEVCRPETEQWLRDNGISYTQLLMRPEGDSRKDTEVKKEIYENHIQGHYNVLCVFDDRDQVVDMWRSLGITCAQVNYGSF